MTPNFDASDRHRQNQKFPEKNNAEQDRFELLSAYLDGELTPSERQQIQQWLDADANFKQLYHRLLRLRHGMQNLSVPAPEAQTKQLSEQVFLRVDRQKRFKKLWLLTGGAVAAVFVSAISGIFTTSNSPIVNVAQSESQSEQSTIEPIMIAVAVDKPAVKIPKAAFTSRQLSIDSLQDK